MIAAAVVILAGLRAAAEIVVPILLAFFLAFVSSPLVFRLGRARMPYRLAVALVLLLQVGVLTILGVLVARSAGELQARLPVLRDRIGDAQDELVQWLALHGGLRAHEAANLVDTGSIVDRVADAALKLGSLLGSGVLMVLVLAFTLFDASRLWRLLDAHISDGDDEHLISRVSVEVNRYLSIKTSISLLTGVLLGLWCMALGVDFPLLWALLAFLLNYVPNVGSIMAAIPPILVAWIMQSPGVAVLVAAGYVSVNMILGNIIEPKLMGSALGISPLVVILSIVLWGWLLGPIGALLSAPLTMIVKIALDNTREWAWVADLMSNPTGRDERPIPSPREERDGQPAQPR